MAKTSMNIAKFKRYFDDLVKQLKNLEADRQKYLDQVDQIDDKIKELVGNVPLNGLIKKKMGSSSDGSSRINVNGPMHEVIANWFESRGNKPARSSEIMNWLIDQGRMTTAKNFDAVVFQILRHKLFKRTGKRPHTLYSLR